MPEHEKTFCGVGKGSPQPCPHTAVVKMYDRLPVCEGHKALFELTPRTNELEVSLAYLKRWVRAAERYPDAEPLLERLVAIRDQFAAELADLEAEARRIMERYSLPPDGMEQLEAKKRDEEDAGEAEPTSEAERRWRELDDRASSFIAAAENLEAEIDGLHERLEESVLSLLEEEADKASEKATRMKARFGP